MFGQRSIQSELMDDPALDGREHVAALRGLRRVHTLTGTVERLWQPIAHAITARGATQLSILDVGCGDGWILRQLWYRARRHGCQLHLTGCDFSPRALDLCAQVCRRKQIPIQLHEVDVTRESLPRTADVVINSFFLHHFSDAHVVLILEQMAASAERLLLIEDLVRSRLGYHLCWLGVHALSRCHVVHVDGPLSVRAAFSLTEMRALLNQAGLDAAQLQRRWPERLVVTWQRPHELDQSRVDLRRAPHGR